MKMLNIVPGDVLVEIVGADITGLLTEICLRGIMLRSISHRDMLTVMASVAREDYRNLTDVVTRKGGKVRAVRTSGVFWRLSVIVKRPLLLLGIACIFLLTLVIPSRILFVHVTGNNRVPTNLILECAELSGVHFGAFRRAVRSETVKNSILDYIPSLQWVGVNTQGCVAIIAVEERPEQIYGQESKGVSSIVANRDGIITSCTATKGNLQCSPGQAVQKGETLISGYTDVGLCIRATQAEGEIFASTEHSVSLSMPANYIKEGYVDRAYQKISLLFGKKRINLYNNSGILGDICDRMYKEYYLTLPGGYRLPFGFAVEQIKTYSSSVVSSAEEYVEAAAQQAAEAYLAERMISGQILRSTVIGECFDGVYTLSGSYICEEMIGAIKQEEIIEYYGKNNGENR